MEEATLSSCRRLLSLFTPVLRCVSPLYVQRMPGHLQAISYPKRLGRRCAKWRGDLGGECVVNVPFCPQVSANYFAAGDDVTNSRTHFTSQAVPVCISQAAAPYMIGQP